MGILKVKTKGGKPSWIRYTLNRIKRNKNALYQITGPTGSGKTYDAMAIGLQLDDGFDGSRIVFGLRGLMALINKITSGEIKQYPGMTFLWDEFQLDASNRNWQSPTNKLLNSLLSTFRHQRFVLLVTTPFSDFIDKQSRKLFHAEFETLSIDEKTGKAALKPMLTQYNARKGKFYHKYLRVKTRLGVAPIKKWIVHKPPKWLCEEYELQKVEFTTELNISIQSQLDAMDDKPKSKELTDLQEQALKLMANFKDKDIVAEKMEKSIRTVNFHLAQAKKKGYSPDNYTPREGMSGNIDTYEGITSPNAGI